MKDDRNSGAFTEAAYVNNIASFTAGTTYDNAKQTSASIDRADYNYPQSCKLVLNYNAAITSAKALQLAVGILDSEDDTNWNAEVALQAAKAIHSLTTGASVTGTFELDIDLSAYERYIKFTTTANLTATGTDTCKYTTVALFGGQNQYSTSKTGVAISV
jgi:hypothetical protein